MKGSTKGAIAIGLLTVVSIGGFFLARGMTNGGRGTAPPIPVPPPPTPTPTKYSARFYLGDEGWFAAIYTDGVRGEMLGPFESEDVAMEQASKWMEGVNADRWWTLHQNGSGAAATWFFDGWSRGVRLTSDGPFSSEQAATNAANSWVESG